MVTLKCDHIKRLITLTSDYIKRISCSNFWVTPFKLKSSTFSNRTKSKAYFKMMFYNFVNSNFVNSNYATFRPYSHETF